MCRSLRFATGIWLALVLHAAAQDAVQVRVAPIAGFDTQHPEEVRFGPLQFVGGLQIDSPDRRFGGLSGIETSADGRQVMMVSDVGDLFTGTIDYRDGVPIGLSDVSVRRLVGESGEKLGEKYGADAESLRAATGRGLPSDVLIGFERDNRVLSYKIDGRGNAATASRLAVPDAVGDLPYNKGLEGIAVVPPGAPNAGGIVMFAESEEDAAPGVIRGWLIAGGKTRELGLRRTGGFDLTDLVALPDGDLIVLERKFSILTGVAMRLRRLRAAELGGPQPMNGETLFAAGMAHAVDNMEGLATHQDESGRTILTIVSDDNFSALQRTLLLQFELTE
jgi:hypothetical protein